MGSLSDYSENELLDHIFNAAYTAPTTIYLALATADPTDAGTGASMNECANSNSYARTAITFGAAASRRVTQNADVDFPQATGSWGTVTHWGIVDSATHGAGNLLAHGAFTTSYPVVNGNSPTVASTEVYVEIQATAAGAGLTDYAVHKLLDLMFRNQAFSKPATYLAISETVLNDQDVADTDFTECNDTGYARKLVNINGGASPTWDLASGGALSNTHAIAFPTVGAGGWASFVAVAIIDSASSTGNVIGYDSANVTDQAANEGDTVQFAIGAFDVTLT